MERNNKTYSFTVAIYEYGRTIESLWPTVKDFARLHPEHIAPDNALAFLTDDTSNGLEGSNYNLCHVRGIALTQRRFLHADVRTVLVKCALRLV